MELTGFQTLFTKYQLCDFGRLCPYAGFWKMTGNSIYILTFLGELRETVLECKIRAQETTATFIITR